MQRARKQTSVAQPSRQQEATEQTSKHAQSLHLTGKEAEDITQSVHFTSKEAEDIIEMFLERAQRKDTLQQLLPKQAEIYSIADDPTAGLVTSEGCPTVDLSKAVPPFPELKLQSMTTDAQMARTKSRQRWADSSSEAEIAENEQQIRQEEQLSGTAIESNGHVAVNASNHECPSEAAVSLLREVARSNERGACPPPGSWDPLDLSKCSGPVAEDAESKRPRIIELQHGRVSMEACSGHIERPEYRASTMEFKFEDTPNGPQALDKTISVSWMQNLAFVGLNEIFHLQSEPEEYPGQYDWFGHFGIPGGERKADNEMQESRQLAADMSLLHIGPSHIIGASGSQPSMGLGEREGKLNQAEDVHQQQQTEANRNLENYLFIVWNTLKDDQVFQRLNAQYQDTVLTALRKALTWLSNKKSTDNGNFSGKLKEIESEINPIMEKAFQGAG